MATNDRRDRQSPLNVVQSPMLTRHLLEQQETTDPKQGDNDGNAPLHMAVMRGSYACARVIHWLCANVHATNKSAGQTPLHVASFRVCGELLLRARANGLAVDSFANTPLHTAL